MIKLKEIIQRLDDEVYASIESSLVKNKADNFLCLFQSYRKNIPDNNIIEELKLNNNSFYVLKSRLLDKIQGSLSGDVHANREELLRKLSEIPALSVNEPREVVIAYLQKLEKDMLEYDMHPELLLVYSALKKLFLFSDRYFHYSQLYNKHIAYSLSLEKTEENMGVFNRVSGEYDFSRSQKHLDTLMFLRKEVKDHFALNGSRQIEIIKNILDLQLAIFCQTSLKEEINSDKLLSATEALMLELPEKSAQKSWLPVVLYFRFEHNLKLGHLKEAGLYYDRLQEAEYTLPLLSHVACVSGYFVSKVHYLQKTGRVSELANADASGILFDPEDTHSRVKIGIYDAMISYYLSNFKEAASKFNDLLNNHSFKDYFHIGTELKLTLVYLYILLKEYELADSTLKGVYRKIKSDKIEGYNNALDIIKVFELEIKQGGKPSAKQKDHYALFQARNKGQSELLRHLSLELDKKYS